jgi:two-component system, cell cycle response regulator
MLSRRRATLIVVRPLFRYPYLFVSLLLCLAIYFWEPVVAFRYAAVALNVLLAIVSYWVAPRPWMGKLARRRLVEGAVILLVTVEILARTGGFAWANLLAFPLFLAWVYAGYRFTEIAFLFLLHASLRLIGQEVNVVPILLLAHWVTFSAFYKRQELKKRRHVTDRLNLYESEASNLESRSEEVQRDLRIDEKKKVHLASTLRQREKNFQSLLELLGRTFDPHTVALYLYDPHQEGFVLKDHITDSDRFSVRRVQPLEGIFRAVLRETSPIRLVSENGLIRGLSYYDGVPKVRSVLALPLRSHDSLKGVLIVDRLEARAFTEEETESIELIAEQLARAMDQSEALHAYFHLMEELSSFYSSVSALNRCLRVEDVVQTLLASSREMIHYDWGLVILYEPITRTNRIVAEGGDDQNGLSGTTFACAPERGLVSWVIKNQAPLYYTSFRNRQGKTPLFHKQMRVPNLYDSVLLVPLQLKGEALGALLFAARKDEYFSKTARKMIEVTAVQAAASLKNARMVDQLEQLATTDGLTGLVNHRTFHEIFASEIERASRHPAAISLLLVDVDFFKKFNDEYGHPIGDFVLREIASVLRRVVRKVDTVARYGGEEFAVVLVNTSSIGASQMAARIVQEVSRSRFQHQGLTLHVTVSVGVTTFPDDSLVKEELIEFADRALYESKEKGRNRSTIYHPGLGKMNQEKTEKILIDATEDEARRMVDPA